VKRENLFTPELDLEQSREGCHWRARRLGERLGAELMGGTIYDVEAEQLTFPFHFHHGIEEWLYVIAGQPTLRTPEGERTVRAGALVLFEQGPAGAHSIRGPGRVLIVSASHQPSISVYPDSDKLGTRPPHSDDVLNFRRADAVGYWEGESPPPKGPAS
jgi:uncharacterized cupin superfamily protein